MTTLLILIFVLGYFFIAFEHVVNINKAATSLIMGVLLWAIIMLYGHDAELTQHSLSEHLSELAGILFFLIGAMTIVELIDAHDGFEIITRQIKTTNKKKLIWILAPIAFLLSAVLDNLTTTIVMISLIRKLMNNREDKLIFAGIIVIAANAGGAFSPIGDVTTTMLWIGGQISAAKVMVKLFLPSVICLLIPLLLVNRKLKGQVEIPVVSSDLNKISAPKRDQIIILFSGIGVLIMVPVFKSLLHLPPYMGMMLGLGILWVISELIHRKKDQSDKNFFSVLYALRKVDMPSVLFFFGILLAISALQDQKILVALAEYLNKTLPGRELIVTLIGLLSAVVDNVPLVAASMGMYDLNNYPIDSNFWHYMAYCSGTGGSILIIGSAAGVAAMGMENISFGWYLKKISLLALLGYLGGAVFFILLNSSL